MRRRRQCRLVSFDLLGYSFALLCLFLFWVALDARVCFCWFRRVQQQLRRCIWRNVWLTPAFVLFYLQFESNRSCSSFTSLCQQHPLPSQSIPIVPLSPPHSPHSRSLLFPPPPLLLYSHIRTYACLFITSFPIHSVFRGSRW